jgi:uncharacterized protein YjbI with pentapeptide repeats
MRFVKPQVLSVLVRPVCVAGTYRLGLAGLTMFDLDAPDAMLPETSLWEVAARELGASGALDTGVPKARAEVLVVGNVYPHGRPNMCTVRLRVGAVDKSIAVFGDRRWTQTSVTDPAPFERMPLSWAHAFGGAEFPANPIGKSGELLPNFELPDRLIRSREDRPPPAGLGPIDPMWSPRIDRAGTYDQKWLKTEYPGFASDTDWRYFNLAPDDQHLNTLAGGEEIVLTNVHPSRPEIVSRVPAHQLRCLVQRGANIADMKLSLTTLWLFPESLRGVAIHHGWAEIEDDDARDVDCLLMAAESREHPRTTEHYSAELERRSTRERAALAILDDTPLVPEGTTGRWTPATTGPALEGRALRRAHTFRKTQVGEARARAEALGLDPDDFAPAMPEEPEPFPSMDQIPALLAKAQAEADRHLEEGKAKLAEERAALRERLTAAGIDPDDFMKDDPPRGPPSFRAESERNRLRELAAQARASGVDAGFIDELADGPEHVARYEQSEQKLHALYRQSAHYSSGPRIEPDPSRAEELLARIQRGESLRAVDFSGVELVGASLRGAQLDGIYLECAVLRGCDLRDAVLTEAVLAGAELHECELSGARFDGANVGGGRWTDGNAAGASFAGAVLGKLRAERVSFEGARLEAADFTEAALVECDLSRADLRRAVFYRSEITNVIFDGADLGEAAILEVALAGSRFDGAKLERTVMYGCDASGVSFRGASMTNLRLLAGCKLKRAILAGAVLRGANLRGAKMKECDLTGCDLDGADLSEVDFTGSKLDGARMRTALMTRTILRNASLRDADLLDAMASKADLRGADLRGASLYGTDLALVQRDENTLLDGANTTRARTVPERRT